MAIQACMFFICGYKNVKPTNITLQRLIEFIGPGPDLMVAIMKIRTGLNNFVSQNNLDDMLNNSTVME